MERKFFYADAFPHHETCGCKSCVAENEGRFESESTTPNTTRSAGKARDKDLQKAKHR